MIQLIHNKVAVLLIFLIISSVTLAQNYIKYGNLKSNFAKSENKKKYYGNLIKNIEQTFDKKYSNQNSNWISPFRNAQSMLLKSNSVEQGLKSALNLKTDSDIKLQRVTLEIAFTLYKKIFEQEVERIFNESTDDISCAISLHYLVDSNKKKNEIKYYLNAITKKFGKEPKNLVLQSLLKEFQNDYKKTPSIEELLNHNFQNGKTIIYSFHRKNREYPGITVIKKPNGEFVRNADSSIFHITQLALSYSNLPSYIPSGNTPQGIYSIIGWYISPTETIGPTPNVLLRSPLEVHPEIFFHNQNKSRMWNKDEYKNLLPDSWKNYEPIYNSYISGQIGRKLIIMHGSTDEIEYFSDKPYYPLTPTRGCLSAKEIWSGENGQCLESDQVKLMNAFRSTGQKEGFLVVIELDDKKKAVSIEDISPFMNK